MRKFLTVHGKQMGNPEQGVERIFEAVTGEGMAGHLSGKVSRLILGKDAYDRCKKTNDQFSHELSLQAETAESTAFKE
jgi:hypothetical protein